MSKQGVAYNAVDQEEVHEELKDKPQPLKTSRTFDIRDIPLKSWESRWSTIRPWLIIIMLVAIMIFQILIVRFPVLMGDLDNTGRTLYTTGVTIAATIVSAYTMTEIRYLWLQRLAKSNVKSVQVLLQIGSTKDQIRLYWLSIPLLVFGLITAAITGSTAIGIDIHQQSIKLSLYSDEPVAYADSPWNKSSTPAQDGFSWQDQDGLYIKPAGRDLPLEITKSMQALDLLFNNIFLDNAKLDGACYSTLGGLVTCSALGAPISLDTDCNLLYSLGCPTQTEQISVCAPVFNKNPVSCQGRLSSDISTSTCKPNTTYTNNGVMIGACAGKAMGAINVLIASKVKKEFFLVATNVIPDIDSMNETTSSNETYALVDCSIDLNNTIVFETVTNSTYQRRDNDKIPGIPTLISTGQKCDPGNGLTADSLLSPVARVFAALTMYRLGNDTDWATKLSDGQYIDLESSRTYGYTAFNNSANLFSSLYGVSVAAAMGFYSADAQSQTLTLNAVRTTPANRVGSGNASAVLYILPLLGAVIAVLWLWIGERRSGLTRNKSI